MTRGQTVLLLVQVIFAAGLFWSCFCRLALTDRRTVREIRWAIWLEGVAAGVVLGAPILPLLVPELLGRGPWRWQVGGTPTWAWALLLIAAALVQFSTARHWRRGVPPDFREGESP